MTEKIRVKFYDSDELAEIVFEDNKIDIISADSKMKESLEECLESWKKILIFMAKSYLEVSHG